MAGRPHPARASLRLSLSPRSLRDTILAAVVGVTLLVLVTFSIRVDGVLRRETTRRLVAEATILGTDLQSAAEESLAARPGGLLELEDINRQVRRAISAGVKRSPSIVYVRLVNSRGRAIGVWSDLEESGILPSQVVDVVLPIRPAGRVVVGVARPAISAELARVRREILAVAFALGALATVVALLVSRRITRPLVRLNDEALLVAQGQLDREIPIHGRDETGQLAESFNRMVRAIREMRAADRAANPLTGLPGNEPLLAELTARLERGEKFAACYMDLDNFKAYNDSYGFVRGDEALLALGRILTAVAAERGSGSTFVGHIGGDDFLVICAPEEAEPLGAEVIARFDAAVPALYSAADRARGHVIVTDRSGKRAQTPLMSLSIAVVTNRHRDIAHTGELSLIAAQLKKKAKATPGSVLVVDKRRS